MDGYIQDSFDFMDNDELSAFALEYETDREGLVASELEFIKEQYGIDLEADAVDTLYGKIKAHLADN